MSEKLKLVEQMFSEGYTYYVPQNDSEQRAVFIDQQAANRSKCSGCGKHTHYEGFRKGDSYRAFVVCNVCEHYEEL